MQINKARFDRFWKGTEIIRAYECMLFTYSDTKLHYILAAEHPKRDRVTLTKGIVRITEPVIIVPGHGPQFGQGFEYEMPPNLALIIRSIMPYCNITNQPLHEETLEYGSLFSILKEYEKRLKASGDKETGLIKGIFGGLGVSLMQYVLMLSQKSVGGNLRELLEHNRDRTPIGEGEKLTDKDMLRLLGRIMP